MSEKKYGQNRCRRCDRPISDITAKYGAWCAKIMGSYVDDETLYLEKNDYEMRSPYNDEQQLINMYDNITNNTNKVSFLPATDWREASDIIRRNATAIKNAGAYYQVNPAIIAACIYTEQITNVNVIDHLTDLPAFFIDTSVGIGQVKVSTAKMLEDKGYIEKTIYSHSYQDWHAQGYIKKDVWYAPAYGYVEGSREKAIAYRLTNESENINYVAAYLRYFQDKWKPYYPEIDGRTAILATLFNQGEVREPHNSPKSNWFGEKAKKEYYYMRELLEMDL